MVQDGVKIFLMKKTIGYVQMKEIEDTVVQVVLRSRHFPGTVQVGLAHFNVM